MKPLSDWVSCSPCAKLNLFLDVLGRRDDGFHELDSIMVAIDWRDELRLRRVEKPGVELRVDWLPSRVSVARELNVPVRHSELLDVPTDHRNLVHRSLILFQERMGWDGGWEVELGKRIPSGAGLGGASSDAAAAILLASSLVQSSGANQADRGNEPASGQSSAATFFSSGNEDESESGMNGLRHELAGQIGSDVPFFLGPHSVARARGRGERLAPVRVGSPLHFVVIYPPESISTAAVYAALRLQVGQSSPVTSKRGGAEMEAAIERGDGSKVASCLHNALQSAARGLSSRIDHALECLARVGLTSSMMTGSGSACFAMTASADEARFKANQLRGLTGEGAIIRAVASCWVPVTSAATEADWGNRNGNN